MPGIDHSPLLLDAGAMLGVLSEHLPSLRGAGACRIHQTRRRVSRKTEEQGAPYLGVVYELPADVGPTPVERWCYLKAFSLGASRTARAANALHLEALDALAWTLPHDPVLSQLAAFLDAERVQRTVRTMLGSADAVSAQSPTVAIVRYEPESHCTARFELNLHGRRLAVYGKAYADDAWSDAARRSRALWSTPHADAFAVARPFAAGGPLHALWQIEACGTPLREVLHGAQATTALARVARGLARLQAGVRLAEATLAPADLLARTTKQCRKLTRADASLAALLDPVLASLQRLPRATAMVTAHGDLHADQLLCAGDRVVLFDFDNFALASPAHDVADFVSQVLTDDDFDEAERFALARGFIDQCMDVLPQPSRRDELDWHLRALLLRKAYSFFVRHRPGWRARVLEAAALASSGLDALWPQPARRAA